MYEHVRTYTQLWTFICIHNTYTPINTNTHTRRCGRLSAERGGKGFAGTRTIDVYYIYMYTRFINVHTHMHLGTDICTFVLYACVYIYEHVCLYTYIPMYVQIYIYIHIYIYKYTYMYIHVFVYIHIHIHILYTYIK